MILTKSKFVAGSTCSRKLWLSEYKSSLAIPQSVAESSRIEFGKRVNNLAKSIMPGGVLIAEKDHAAAVRRTEAAISSGCFRLYGAAFSVGAAFASVDILSRLPNGSWELIEVKSSSRVKDEHLHEMAFQVYVLESVGLKIGSAAILCVDGQAPFEAIPNLFQRIEVLEQIRRLRPKVAHKISSILQEMNPEHEPSGYLSKRCKNSHCSFRRHCFRDIPKFSIFTVPGQLEQQEQLSSAGKWALSDLPTNLKLTKRQKEYLQAVRDKRPVVDSGEIKQRLARLVYPLYFFDVEACSLPIPLVPGMHPFEQLPFQFSCHVLDEKGGLSHYEFLQRDHSDPRPCFVEALLQVIGDRGSVIAYNASFERFTLKKLAKTFPSNGQKLESIAQRLWDQLEIFRRFYLHPEFLGSSSIKRVLPVIAPGLGYANMAVKNGDDAPAVWLQMINETSPGKKQSLVEALTAYCALDTFAMVKIHDHLLSL